MQMGVSVYIDTFARGSRNERISLRRASDATPVARGKKEGKGKARAATRPVNSAHQSSAECGLLTFPLANEPVASFSLSRHIIGTSKLAGRVDTSEK